MVKYLPLIIGVMSACPQSGIKEFNAVNSSDIGEVVLLPSQRRCIDGAVIETILGKRNGLRGINSGLELCLLEGDGFGVKCTIYVVIPKEIRPDIPLFELTYSLCIESTKGNALCAAGGRKKFDEARRKGDRYNFDNIVLPLREELREGDKPKVSIRLDHPNPSASYSQDFYLKKTLVNKRFIQ